jgi:hypothetical protein
MSVQDLITDGRIVFGDEVGSSQAYFVSYLNEIYSTYLGSYLLEKLREDGRQPLTIRLGTSLDDPVDASTHIASSKYI